MQDAITSVVNRYDLTGRYLDPKAIKELTMYFETGLNRIIIAELINRNTAAIVQDAAKRLFEEQPELLRPGGNSYTTRRYAACLRDIEYYLRYASYALIAGNNNILEERVLDGLKDTYNSLQVPIAPTVRAINFLKEVILEKLEPSDKILIEEPFTYLTNALN
uniref:Allophycocyanin beta 18 subunit n=1 Tax=Bangiopsis subsimplex TaxID=139980 RepID=A0A1C9CCH2_9RHOD|nr:Allophycocyanin beta 18 subunit [Bangiopsis subsimplex]AOM66091.1 Allophycocyanin beta 18 subunit [Bangiopsis subsimplex]ARO90353.1 allophycocyanin beta 18 subunit [Bangiopsis subsimplex]